MSAGEQRQQILGLLCQRRKEPIHNLAAELEVCEKTIRRDIKVLTLSYPIETCCGRYGGGVKMADWYYRDRRRPVRGGAMLCAADSNLTAKFRRTLWRQGKPIVLTSSTLAVGSDFRRFKEETGLLTDDRVLESVTPSPFDYSRNCLLYIPQLPPGRGDKQYSDHLSEEIAALLGAAHGHALVLFTPYSTISSVKERLQKRDISYPLFTLGRNAVHTMEQFKRKPGSVLPATGVA